MVCDNCREEFNQIIKRVEELERKLDKISYITGRITDFLIGTNGNRVSGAAVTPFFAKLRGINEFRIVQEHKDVVRVMLVRSKTVDPTISPSINKFLKKFLGDRMHIKLEFCRKIPKLKSAKFPILSLMLILLQKESFHL